MSTSSHPPPAVRKRSRSGCYICRVRKVKCEPLASTNAGDRRTSRECLNCQRLGFECRWQPPASGEKFEPPPKRRRAAARQVETRTISPGNQSEASPEMTSPKTYQQLRDERADPSMDALFDTDGSFSALGPEPGFILGANFMDFNVDAEGMDFIPLPMIDPSLLSSFTDSTQPEPMMNWSLASQDDDAQPKEQETHADSPSINDDNRRLVQHYLDVMKGYSKVDEPSKDANNLFISAFSRSLCFPPLFAAILAFSAAHLSIQDPSYAPQAASLDAAAQSSIASFRSAPEPQVEGLLSALFIRVKKIHVMGDDLAAFLALISDAADIISTDQGQKALQDPEALTRRIILRLAILDARAACYRLGGGALVTALRAMPPLADVFRAERTPDTVASPGPVASLLRANVFHVRVADLDARLQRHLTSDVVARPVLKRDDFTALADEIQREITLWDSRLSSLGLSPYGVPGTEDEPLDSAAFSCSAVLSALHSSMLYLDHIFPLPHFDRDAAVGKILRYQLRLHNDASRRDSPSSTSPSSLFFAALVTRDAIHRDWALKVLRKGERWGRYVGKTRRLLEAMFKARREGEEVDVAEMMDRVTGRFVI